NTGSTQSQVGCVSGLPWLVSPRSHGRYNLAFTDMRCRVERWIGKFARGIKVHKTCAHIILQAKSTILTDTGLEESVDNYVGNGIAGEIVDQEQTYVGLSGTCVNITAFAELVVVNIDPFTMDIVIGVGRNGYT